MASLIADNNIDAAVQPATYNIQVKFKAKKLNIPIVPNSTTLSQFQYILEERTGIEVINQKLLLKGKQLQNVLQPNQILYDIKQIFHRHALDMRQAGTCCAIIISYPNKHKWDNGFIKTPKYR